MKMSLLIKCQLATLSAFIAILTVTFVRATDPYEKINVYLVEREQSDET